MRKTTPHICASNSVPVSADLKLTSQNENPYYRPEIDGLRAVAVLSVILYHAGIPLLTGGYLGVDIFFVISGYLITRILQSEIGRGSFTFAHFYERRARRLLPALIATSIVCIPAAVLLMLPDDLENFGQSLVATQLFANNVLLFLTSDYFALEAEFKPLMHTWSLGVEEQYYLVAPVAMLALEGIRRNSTPLVIGGMTLMSFAFSTWAAESAPEANFYLIFSRTWELGAGALVAFGDRQGEVRTFVSRGLSHLLCLAGVLMLFASFVLFNEHTPSPGLATLWPVIGVCLLLMFADSRHGPGRWLSSKALVSLGLISYSAYLIHQPIFAFARITSLAQPSLAVMAALVPLILFLAYLSWRFVEVPFRDNRRISTRTMLICSMLGSLLIITGGAAMYLTSGFYNSRPELRVTDSSFGARQNSEFNRSALAYSNISLPSTSTEPRLLVVGDSFGRDFINMGLASGRLRNVAVSYSGVPHCETAIPAALVANVRNADLIVLASDFATDNLITCVDRRYHQLREISSARILVAGTKNFGWNNNAVMLLPEHTRYAYRTLPLAEVVTMNARARVRFGVDYVDILRMISDPNGRVPVFTPDRHFISQDRKHLTPAGAAYLGALVYDTPALQSLVSADHRAPQPSP